MKCAKLNSQYQISYNLETTKTRKDTVYLVQVRSGYVYHSLESNEAEINVCDENNVLWVMLKNSYLWR